MEKKEKFMCILKTILVFILFYYSWLFQLIPVFLLKLDVEKLSGSANVLLSAFSSLILGIIIFFMYRKEIKVEFKRFREKFGQNMDTGLRYWLIGLSFMMLFNSIISAVFKGGQAGNEQAVQSMITALPWMMLISAGVLAPWCEEFVFRKSFKNLFKNKWLYIMFSGFLFGLAHVIGNVNVWTDWLFILPYGSLGVAFAAAYHETDTIFTPIAFHMIHNILLVLISII